MISSASDTRTCWAAGLCLLPKSPSRNQTIITECSDCEHERRIRRVDLSAKMNYFKNHGIPFHRSRDFLSQREQNIEILTLPWIFHIPYSSMSALTLWSHFFFSKYLHDSNMWVKVIFTANLLLFIKDTKPVWHEEVLDNP